MYVRDSNNNVEIFQVSQMQMYRGRRNLQICYKTVKVFSKEIIFSSTTMKSGRLFK